MDIQTPCSDTRGGSIGIIKWVCMAATLVPIFSRHLRYSSNPHLRKTTSHWHSFLMVEESLQYFQMDSRLLCPGVLCVSALLRLYLPARTVLDCVLEALERPPPPIYSSHKTVSMCGQFVRLFEFFKKKQNTFESAVE